MWEEKIDSIIVRICVGVLFVFLLSIMIRVVTQEMLYEKLGITNHFVQVILEKKEEKLLKEKTQRNQSEAVNWLVLYPFQEEREENKKDTIITSNIKVWQEKIKRIEEKVERYTSGDELFQRIAWIELANRYENWLNWNLICQTDYNAVVKLEDNYLTAYQKEINVDSSVTNMIDLKKYLNQLQIPMLYIQAPHKISKYEDKKVSGIYDFSNQNADKFLAEIKKQEIDSLDLRENIYQEGLEHHPLFYKTDHHWKAETGLWASRFIAEKLNKEYGFTINLDVLEKDNFESKVYPNYLLGSQGKKITLAKTTPEDFTVFYPKQVSSLTLNIPEKNLKLSGDFSILYNKEEIDTVDYYHKDPYGAYMYGNTSLITVKNNQLSNGKKLLLIKDSFANVVSPFLCLGVEEIHILDQRYYNGSIKSYIESTRPDMVMILYNPSCIIFSSTPGFR